MLLQQSGSGEGVCDERVQFSRVILIVRALCFSRADFHINTITARKYYYRESVAEITITVHVLMYTRIYEPKCQGDVLTD